MSEAACEVQTNRRLLHLDIVRGLALLGILLVNFKSFVNPVTYDVVHPELPGDPLNAGVEIVLRTFFEGKFYVAFSILFGVSFALLSNKSAAEGSSFARSMLRRLISLGLFGLLHAILLWNGDILLLYSMTGMLLFLFFRKTSVSRLGKWAVTFVLIPLALLALAILALQLNTESQKEARMTAWSPAAGLGEDIVRLAASTAAQRYGTYIEVVKDNIGSLIEGLSLQFASTLFIIPYFLIGCWLQRSGRLCEPKLYQSWWNRMILVGLTAGLPLSLYGALVPRDSSRFNQETLTYTLCLFISGTLLALSYIGLLSLYGHRFRVLRWLAPAGRMALTNYLTQSLMWTLLCYGYGLGLAPYLQSRALHIPLSLGFFVLQVHWSHWWLARFAYGPVEYLWRWVTDWKKPAARAPAERS